MKRRKWLSLLLSFTMVMTMLPTLTMAEEESIGNVSVFTDGSGCLL